MSQLGLCAFSEKCFEVIGQWFGITAPVLSTQISDDFYEFATDMFLSDGVFGQLNQKSIVDNSVMNTVRKRGRLSPMLSFLFPSYQWMKAKYPGTAKSPLLLPMMWVRRVMESLLRRSAGDALVYASRYLVKNRNMKEREAMLKQWGLL